MIMYKNIRIHEQFMGIGSPKIGIPILLTVFDLYFMIKKIHFDEKYIEE